MFTTRIGPQDNPQESAYLALPPGGEMLRPTPLETRCISASSVLASGRHATRRESIGGRLPSGTRRRGEAGRSLLRHPLRHHAVVAGFPRSHSCRTRTTAPSTWISVGRHEPEGPCRTSEGPSARVLIGSYVEAGSCGTLLLRLLPAEAVEFSVLCASEKSMPFVRCKSENWPLGVPAVAYADLAVGQARHLDAVTVGETERALDPVRT